VALKAPELVLADSRRWRAWLEGVWLVLAKKGTTKPTRLSYSEALEEALCFGWIDGQLGSRDEATFLRRFTPRRPDSPWSRRNVEIVERLVAQGKMHESGESAIEQAREDGRWQMAYAGQATIDLPSDFATALAAEPTAQAMFEILTSANRYSILYRITEAKRSATRKSRIEKYVSMLARGETIHPQQRSLDD